MSRMILRFGESEDDRDADPANCCNNLRIGLCCCCCWFLWRRLIIWADDNCGDRDCGGGGGDCARAGVRGCSDSDAEIW